MFVFDNAITAGTVLVRQQLESQNYTPSGGLAGWAIFANGNAVLNNVTLRGDLQSANYVAGVSGYKLTFATGSAEFYNITARGNIKATELDIGPGRIHGYTNVSGDAQVDLFSLFNDGTDAETGPAIVRLGQNPSFPTLDILSDDIGHGRIGLSLSPEATGNDGYVSFDSVATNPGKIFFSSLVYAVFENTTPVGLASTREAILIGDQTNAFDKNVVFDDWSIQARNAGAKGTLRLNPAGGSVTATDMRAQKGNDGGPISTTSTTFVNGGSTAAATVATPASGDLLIIVTADISNSVAANAGDLTFELRETNSGGTILIPANVGRAARCQGTNRTSACATYLAEGISTTATVLYARAMFASDNAANTATFRRIYITLVPIL